MRTGNIETPQLLIVDDDPDLLEILVDLLSADGRNVIKASNASDALKQYLNPEYQSQNPIHAILSDMNMPQISGLELLMAHKAQDFFGTFLFLTGYADRMKLFLGMRYGAFDFMEKPYNSVELESVIAEALGMGMLRCEINRRVPSHLGSMGLSHNQILRYFRKVQRVCDLDVGMEVGDGKEILSHFQAVQTVKSLDEALADQFRKASESMLSKHVEQLKRLRDPKTTLSYLRSFFHCVSLVKRAALSLGYEDIGQCMSEFKNTALYLRGFPQLFEASRFDIIERSLRNVHSLFRAELQVHSISDSTMKIVQDLKNLNERLSHGSFKLL